MSRMREERHRKREFRRLRSGLPASTTDPGGHGSSSHCLLRIVPAEQAIDKESRSQHDQQFHVLPRWTRNIERNTDETGGHPKEALDFRFSSRHWEVFPYSHTASNSVGERNREELEQIDRLTASGRATEKSMPSSGRWPVGLRDATEKLIPGSGRWPADLREVPASHPSHRATEKSMPEIHTAPKSAVRWIEPGGTSKVAGRKLGGMIYLGSEDRWKREGGAAIDPGLPVAMDGTDFSGDGMPYWPSYRDINPQARATFLDWLAGGRSDRRIGPGFVFLYFYGLERRFFVDAPADEEKRLLVAEIRRLLEIYGENHSVQRYLETFLDAAHIALEPAEDAEPRFEKVGYELPLGLRVAIGRMAKEGRPLSADWAAWLVSRASGNRSQDARDTSVS